MYGGRRGRRVCPSFFHPLILSSSQASKQPGNANGAPALASQPESAEWPSNPASPAAQPAKSETTEEEEDAATAWGSVQDARHHWAPEGDDPSGCRALDQQQRERLHSDLALR
jgi:hypothetical protein